MSLSNQPLETLFEVMLYLPYPSVINQCKINKKFASICESEFFWKKYLSTHLDIDFPINSLTFSETAQVLYMFLDSIFRLSASIEYISTWALRNILLYFNTVSWTKEQIYSFFQLYTQQINHHLNSTAVGIYQLLFALNKVTSNFSFLKFKELKLYQPKHSFPSTWSTPSYYKLVGSKMNYVTKDLSTISTTFNADDSVMYLSNTLDQGIQLDSLFDALMESIFDFTL
jgi:hypothetical protein